MSRLDDIERQLAEVTHSSQLRAPMGRLVAEVRWLRAQIDALAAEVTCKRASESESDEPEPEAGPEPAKPRGRPRKATAE